MNTRQMKDRPALLPGFSSCWQTALTAALLLAFCTAAHAQYDRNRHGSPGMQQADRHNPFAQGSTGLRSGSQQGNSTTIIGSPFGFGYGSPFLGNPFSRRPYFGQPYANPYYYGSYVPYGGFYEPHFHYYRQPIVLPPVVFPAGTLFGPRALNRFLYGTDFVNPPVVRNANPARNAAANTVTPNANNAAATDPKWAREVSLAMRERAWRFIEMGDKAFLERDYRVARDRYRAASRAAPRVVEAYLKQAQSLIALEKYDLALNAYQRALALPPLWVTANFSLSEQYGPEGQATKDRHLNQLAAAAEQDPNSPDLLLLIGMELFYDQQPERAANFLRKAKELGGQAVDLPSRDAAERNGPPAAAGDNLPIPNPPPVAKDRKIF
ncbi:MAG: tetratricopeptide repeat protein [Pirellulales bacterium]|nr:tetratricopeptide repeat protein [Pirellulales bacterium]